MSYWRYRAFDELLCITEGVMSAPDGDDERAMQTVILQLRQQGLQSIELKPATHAEYVQEERLKRMKDRISLPSQPSNPPPQKARLTIRERLRLIWAAIRGRNNT